MSIANLAFWKAKVAYFFGQAIIAELVPMHWEYVAGVE